MRLWQLGQSATVFAIESSPPCANQTKWRVSRKGSPLLDSTLSEQNSAVREHDIGRNGKCPIDYAPLMGCCWRLRRHACRREEAFLQAIHAARRREVDATRATTTQPPHARGPPCADLARAWNRVRGWPPIPSWGQPADPVGLEPHSIQCLLSRTSDPLITIEHRRAQFGRRKLAELDKDCLRGTAKGLIRQSLDERPNGGSAHVPQSGLG